MEPSSILTPDPKHRLRMGFDLIDSLESQWRAGIKKGDPSYIGPGEGGSLVVINGTFVDALRKAVNASELGQFDSKRKRIENGLFCLWKITPSIEQNRVTITIPKEIRALGLYPESGVPTIVSIYENRFELRPITDLPQPSSWIKETAETIEMFRQWTDGDWDDLGTKIERT